MSPSQVSKLVLIPTGLVFDTPYYQMWSQEGITIIRSKGSFEWTLDVAREVSEHLQSFLKETKPPLLMLVEESISRQDVRDYFLSDPDHQNLFTFGGIVPINAPAQPENTFRLTSAQAANWMVFSSLDQAWTWLKQSKPVIISVSSDYVPNVICLKTRSATLTLHEDFYLESKLHPVEQQIEDAVENVGILKRLAGDRKLPFVLDLRDAKHIDIDARKHYSNPLHIKFASQIAIVVDTLLSKTIGNTMVRLFAKGTQADIRVFTSQNEAIEWFRNWTSGLVKGSPSKKSTEVQSSIGELEVNELLETLTRYSALEFDSMVPIKGKNACFDALGLTINMLGEEIKNSAFTKDYFQQIMNTAPAVLYSCSPTEPFELLFVSDKIYEYGFKREDIIKKPHFWSKHIHAEDLENFLKNLSNYTSTTVNQHYFRFIDGYGDQRWFKNNFKFIKDSKNVVLGVAGFLQDVSPEIKQQDELKEQRGFLNTILNSISEGVCGIDLEGNIIFMNPAGCQMLLYKEEELIGNNFLTMGFHLKDNGEMRSFKDTVIYSTIKDGQVRTSTPSVFWTKDRLEVFVEFTVAPLIKESVRIGAVISFVDTTAKRMAEETIASQKASMINAAQLSALGEMAGGIAHEVNNPLAGIQGKTFQLMRALKAGTLTPERLQSDLQKVYDTSERIAKVIRGLRAFSRNAENDPLEVHSPKHILEQSLEFTQERLRNHGISLDFGNIDDCKIRCRTTQLVQVLIGMINNAYDAILPLKDKWIKIEVVKVPFNASEYPLVQIMVTDSGPGIKPEVAQKIMQPFFTTKGVGKGVGLGLSIAVGIIAEHGGNLFLDDKCPNTRFVIELPIYKKPLELKSA